MDKKLYESLTARGCLPAQQVLDAFNPDQERDDRGRWGSGGPGSEAQTRSEHLASAASHSSMAEEHKARGEHDEATYHTMAAGAHHAAADEHGRVESISKDANVLRGIEQKDPFADRRAPGSRTSDLRDRQAALQKTFAVKASARAQEMSAKANAGTKALGHSFTKQTGSAAPGTGGRKF